MSWGGEFCKNIFMLLFFCLDTDHTDQKNMCRIAIVLFLDLKLRSHSKESRSSHLRTGQEEIPANERTKKVYRYFILSNNDIEGS